MQNNPDILSQNNNVLSPITFDHAGKIEDTHRKKYSDFLLYTCNEIRLIQLFFPTRKYKILYHATRVIFFRITILHVLPNSQDKSQHLAKNS